MNNAVATLFYLFEKGHVKWPEYEDKILFLNAQYHTDLDSFRQLDAVQYFKPFYDRLKARNVNVFSDIEAEKSGYDFVLCLLPKNTIEAQYWIAKGLYGLKEGGVLLCAAPNKAGGNRIGKTLKKFDLKNIQSASKYKSKAGWGIKSSVDEIKIEEAIEAGYQTQISGTKFYTIPGIFGWNKYDRGSVLLTQSIDQDLHGIGADFGCGYGYLAMHVLQNCKNVTQMYCIDADYRSLDMCKKNTLLFRDRATYVWADLTKVLTHVPPLNFIVMNPPFHEEKRQDNNIGKNFIKTAYHHLEHEGVLWLVANNFLPYEPVLKELFSVVEHRNAASGLKVLFAKK